MIRNPKFRAKQDAKIHQFRGRGLGLLENFSVVIVELIHDPGPSSATGGKRRQRPPAR